MCSTQPADSAGGAGTPLEDPEVSVGVVEVGLSLDIWTALEEDDAEAVRGAEHSQAPPTTLQPMDSVGAGPRDVLDAVTLGPNWARAPMARSRPVAKNFAIAIVEVVQLDVT
jgi:hypothetical protein